MSAAWHVATTKPNYSSVAERHLRAQSFRVFNPRIETVRWTMGIRRRTVRQYVPGYIFVHFDAAADEWFPINWTTGIRHLISAAPERPIPVADEVMSLMLDRCDKNGMVVEDQIDPILFRIGQEVRVIDGPLAGRRGIVERITGYDRIRVIMAFMGSSRTVEIRASGLIADPEQA